MCRLTRPRSASERHCTKGPAATSRPRANVAPTDLATTELLARPCCDTTTQQCVHTIVGACSGAVTRITHSVENSGKTPSAVQRIVNAPTGTTNRFQPHSLTCRSRRVHSHAPRLIPREAS